MLWLKNKSISFELSIDIFYPMVDNYKDTATYQIISGLKKEIDTIVSDLNAALTSEITTEIINVNLKKVEEILS